MAQNSSGKKLLTILLALIPISIFGYFALDGASGYWEYRVHRIRTEVPIIMNTVGTELEAFSDSNQRYPKMVPLETAAGSLKALRKAGGVGLTTWEPLPSLPFLDPFSPGGDFPFVYYTDGKGWIITSPGPDRVYDLYPAEFFGKPLGGDASAQSIFYDPTNGLLSSGDIWRTKTAHSARIKQGSGRRNHQP